MKRKQPTSKRKIKVRRTTKHYGELGGTHRLVTAYKRRAKHPNREED